MGFQGWAFKAEVVDPPVTPENERNLSPDLSDVVCTQCRSFFPLSHVWLFVKQLVRSCGHAGVPILAFSSERHQWVETSEAPDLVGLVLRVDLALALRTGLCFVLVGFFLRKLFFVFSGQATPPRSEGASR